MLSLSRRLLVGTPYPHTDSSEGRRSLSGVIHSFLSPFSVNQHARFLTNTLPVLSANPSVRIRLFCQSVSADQLLIRKMESLSSSDVPQNGS